MAKHENFDELKLELGQSYSRDSLDKLQEIESIERTQSGVVQFKNCILLLITANAEKYHNRFDGPKFKMFFQDKSTKNKPIVKRISNYEPTHLFVRKKKTEDYIYLGRVVPTEIFGEKPVDISWLLCDYSKLSSETWYKKPNISCLLRVSLFVTFVASVLNQR